MIQGVNPSARTPLWMRERLRRAGLRPIRPVVDVTNYVMLELGQPLHAYDLRRLQCAHRSAHARAGEKLLLLDGREIALDADDARDRGRRRARSGLRASWAARRAASPPTRPTCSSRARSSHRTPSRASRAGIGLVTDAAQRFERGVDPRGQERAIERATELLVAIAGGRPGPTVVTQDEAQLPKRPSVTLRPERVASLLGVQIPRAEIEDILRRLGMQVAGAGDVLGVIPPSHRFDIAIEQDLIEEVGRIHGYDNIPRTDAKMPQRPQPATERAVTRERLRLLLVDRGYQEVITYSFVDPRLQRLMFPTAARARTRESALRGARPRCACRCGRASSRRCASTSAASRNACASSRSARASRWTAAARREPGRLPDSSRGPALPEQWGDGKARRRFLRHQVGRRGALCADGPAGWNKLCRGGARLPASGPQRRDHGWQGQRRLDRPAAAGDSRASSKFAMRPGFSSWRSTRASVRKSLYSRRFQSTLRSGATWRSWSTKP